MNVEDAYEEYRALIENLQDIGLTVYQAKAFLALIVLGVGSAEIVAETANIPRTSAYKALDSLEEKGYATSAEGRPKVYKPMDLKELRDRAVSGVNELFDKLEFIREFLVDRGEPQLVYTIYGKENVLKKICEMIDLTEKEIIISTPMFSEIRKNLIKQIEQAVSRNIRVVVVTLPNQKIPKDVEVYRKTGLIATDIVSDNKRALLASPELSACGYTYNPSLAQHLTHFINIMIEK